MSVDEGAMLMANSAAILTDAFPAHQRGMALVINQVAGISGQFIRLPLGGLLAAWDWRGVRGADRADVLPRSPPGPAGPPVPRGRDDRHLPGRRALW
jgi:MFS family permease